MMWIDVRVCEEYVDVIVEGEIYGSGGGGEPYTGEYEATPTRETQVFHTGGFVMGRDFVVNPIPSNYGLITHNGFNIMVS